MSQDPNAGMPTKTTIEVPAEEYARIVASQEKLQELERKLEQRSQAREQERLKAMAERGQIQEAFESLRRLKDDELARERVKSPKLEAEILGTEKDRVITDAFAGMVFASLHAAAHVCTILNDRIEAYRDASGAVILRDKQSFQPASHAIREWIASEEAAHFFRGGMRAQGGHRTSAGVGGQPSNSRYAAAHALIEHERARRADPGTNPYGPHKRILRSAGIN